MMNLSHPTHQPNHRSRTADPSIKACEVCDAVVELDAAEKGSVLLCPKCLTVMVRHYTHPFETSLSLAIASLIPFSIVLVAPFLTLAVGGTEATSTVVDTAIVLFNKGFPFVGLLVLLMTLVFPLVRILSLIYVLGPLSIGRVAPGAWFAFRSIETIAPWAMLDVFLVGVLVAVVKLLDLAEVIPNLGLFAFLALLLLTTASSATLDSEFVWERIRRDQR